MTRPITAFRLDDKGDWIAVLSCGHAQHMRHAPPFTSRPWVLTAEGRDSKLGAPVDCVRCDRFEVPEAVVTFKRTETFTEHTVPDGLLKDHTTAPGVWGRITVVEGTLRYRVVQFDTDIELSPQNPGIIVPGVPHSVRPVGKVRFHVEFLRTPGRE